MVSYGIPHGDLLGVGRNRAARHLGSTCIAFYDDGPLGKLSCLIGFFLGSMLLHIQVLWSVGRFLGPLALYSRSS